MLFVLSPAKALDYDSVLPTELPHSKPLFPEQSAELIAVLQQYAPQQIASLMGISDKLAMLNVARYIAWQPKSGADNARQALLAFNGDVYEGLQAATLSMEQLQWAQQHLCILSGLYGVLRPLDWMQPYRLEMGTALPTARGKNLYQFWCLLEGFSGILQADGYSGYSQVCKESGLTRIGCWDHARRKFIEATRAAPKGKDKGKSKASTGLADVALGYIGKLYAIEREQKERSDAERYQARQTRSMPLLAELKTWLDNNVGKVMKGSLTRQAMEYTLGQWPHLVGYCVRGDLHISNILAENAIRPFAVGRKAWLFADSAQGAKASATCYSLLETAKANDLEPSAYINYVLAQIGEADSLEKLEALLPWNVPLEPIAKKVAQYNEGK